MFLCCVSHSTGLRGDLLVAPGSYVPTLVKLSVILRMIVEVLDVGYWFYSCSGEQASHWVSRCVLLFEGGRVGTGRFGKKASSLLVCKFLIFCL